MGKTRTKSRPARPSDLDLVNQAVLKIDLKSIDAIDALIEQALWEHHDEKADRPFSTIVARLWKRISDYEQETNDRLRRQLREVLDEKQDDEMMIAALQHDRQPRRRSVLDDPATREVIKCRKKRGETDESIAKAIGFKNGGSLRSALSKRKLTKGRI